MKSVTLALVWVLGAFAAGGSPAARADFRQHCVASALKTSGALSPDASSQVLELADFKRRYISEFRGLADFRDNAKFQRAWMNQEGKFYFEMENPILKELNDRIFRDQDLSTAVNNLYREKFIQLLEDKNRPGHAWLKKHMLHPYADYKTIRLMFDANTPELRVALASLYQDTAVEFKRAFEKLWFREKGEAAPRSILRYFENQRGIATDPAAFNLCGMGETVWEAGVAARKARTLFSRFEAGKPVAMEFTKVAGALSDDLSRIENLRAWLEKRLSDVPGALSYARKGENRTLGEKAVNILRTVRTTPATAGMGEEGYRQYIRERFLTQFGRALSDDEIKAMQEYYALSDSFSPGIIHVTARPASFEGQGGGLFFDHVGLGTSNALSTMRALSSDILKKIEKPEARVRYALRNTWSEMQQVTVDFNARNKALLDSLYGGQKPTPALEKMTIKSGDELEFYGKLDKTKRKKILADLAARTNPERLRSAWVADAFADGTPVLSTERHRFKEEALSFEKEVRKILEKGKGDYGNVLIHVEWVPSHRTGGGQVGLIVSGEGAKEPAAIEAIQKAYREVLKQRRGVREGGVEVNLPESPLSLLDFFHIPLPLAA